jgi:hypothetical protein
VDDGFNNVISRLWGATGTDDDRAGGWAEGWADGLTTTGPRAVLPAAFDVTGLATGAVAVATLATAHVDDGKRQGTVRRDEGT